MNGWLGILVSIPYNIHVNLHWKIVSKATALCTWNLTSELLESLWRNHELYSKQVFWECEEDIKKSIHHQERYNHNVIYMNYLRTITSKKYVGAKFTDTECFRAEKSRMIWSGRSQEISLWVLALDFLIVESFILLHFIQISFHHSFVYTVYIM